MRFTITAQGTVIPLQLDISGYHIEVSDLETGSISVSEADGRLAVCFTEPQAVAVEPVPAVRDISPESGTLPIERVSEAAAASTGYEYDKAGRITKVATPGKTTVYAYDKAGNRISQNETYVSLQPSEYVDETTAKEIQYILKKSDYTYSNTNQLKQSVSHTLPDNTGLRPKTTGTAYGDNVSSTIDKLMEKTSYTYDGFNRLKRTETIKAGIRTTVDFTYNGDDLRVSKTVKKSDKAYQAEVTNYLYDRQNVILETDAGSNVKARYIKGINYIAKLDASNKESYFLFNGHGDVVQTVDESGAVQNQYDYDIWGNPTLTVETVANPIHYSGEFMDSETGLYYLRARYYDPATSRMLSEDSYWGEDRNPLSFNLYTYCMNDPIQYTDPDGHAAKKGNDAYLTALASAAGGTVKWDSKNKVAVVNVNGIEKKLKTGDYKNVNGKIVIDNNEFDKLFTDTSKRTYTNTSVSNKTISATTLRFDSGYDKQPTVKSGTSLNNLGTKQSPKPKENEKYKVLQNEKKNGVESNNRNDTAVTQVTLDALGFMDMPLRKNGETIDYGYFGSVTEKGVINFQSQYYARNNPTSEAIRYLANGKVDITTWKALGLPVDKKGQPDRNSYAYKELLKVAKDHKTISSEDLNNILTGSSNNNGYNNKSRNAGITRKNDYGATRSSSSNGKSETVEINLSSWLYNYEEDSKKYAISTQITLAKLTTEWFNAKSDKERESIGHLLEAIKRNTDDDWIDRYTEQGMNNIFGGAGLFEFALRAGGFSEEELDKNLDSLLTSKESYMLCQIKNIDTNGSNNVRVFRVEGSINERIIIGENGQVAIENSQKSLFLNFGDSKRANEFLAKRLSQGMSDVRIKSFEVSKSVLDKISSEAVLESEASNFPNRPIRVDITKAENQFGLRSEQIKMIEKEIIENSGKVTKGKVKW